MTRHFLEKYKNELIKKIGIRLKYSKNTENILLKNKVDNL